MSIVEKFSNSLLTSESFYNVYISASSYGNAHVITNYQDVRDLFLIYRRDRIVNAQPVSFGCPTSSCPFNYKGLCVFTALCF